ncbi:hypothetical protein [Planococcus beigongshangi]|uniref:hypothetical protein n=1 Tax=Planococcus beigongshangi TaxID=2782536 RepID=UPI00193BE240|nr:hypothetical protein [Planococcus beigongshangi]
MECKYCQSHMKQEGTDPEPGGFSTLYICENDECRAIFEEWYNASDMANKMPERDNWFKPGESKY